MTASGSLPVPSVASMTAWRAAKAASLASLGALLFGRFGAGLGFFAVCLRDRFGMSHDRMPSRSAQAFTILKLRHYHQTLRVTPAMEAGIADHVWSAEEIVGLLEAER